MHQQIASTILYRLYRNVYVCNFGHICMLSTQYYTCNGLYTDINLFMVGSLLRHGVYLSIDAPNTKVSAYLSIAPGNRQLSMGSVSLWSAGTKPAHCDCPQTTQCSQKEFITANVKASLKTIKCASYHIF